MQETEVTSPSRRQMTASSSYQPFLIRHRPIVVQSDKTDHTAASTVAAVVYKLAVASLFLS